MFIFVTARIYRFWWVLPFSSHPVDLGSKVTGVWGWSHGCMEFYLYFPVHLGVMLKFRDTLTRDRIPTEHLLNCFSVRLPVLIQFSWNILFRNFIKFVDSFPVLVECRTITGTLQKHWMLFCDWVGSFQIVSTRWFQISDREVCAAIMTREKFCHPLPRPTVSPAESKIICFS